ncbi:MAG: CaiB/BaiF CoA transferase family protein, partial [Vulcanimicrobiaceae bacterium]
ADLGADVVKVEPPQGDGLRTWPPVVEAVDGERFSLNFASLNRGKRSIVADLKDPEDLARTRRLCTVADVVIENYRPGVLDRLGIGFDAVAKLQPEIVYCSISGYGQRGPNARRGAFDVVIQGMSGLMSVTGEEDGPPVKCGVPVGDFTAALYAAYTILAARGVAQREHRAIHLDCPMLDCLLGISGLQTSEYWGTGIVPKRLGSAHPRNAPYQAYDASDGPFIVAAGNDALWEAVCEVTGTPQLLGDPRFATLAERAKNQKALAAILQEIFASRTVAQWIAMLEARGVPCGPVNSFADILGDASLVANELIQDLPVPVAGVTKTVSFPVQFNATRVRVKQPPPR